MKKIFAAILLVIYILSCSTMLVACVDGDDDRTCAWCNGTGYSGNGAQTAEEYVFKKTPCTHCGGDGKY